MNYWLKIATQVTGQKVIYPMYHCISNYKHEHIKYLYNYPDKKLFEKQLDFFTKNFTPITLEETILHNQKIKEIKKPSFHLSFDDGFSDIYHTVSPILLKKGIPATFFINPDFIDNRSLMFRCKVSLLLSRMEIFDIEKLLRKLNIQSNNVLNDLKNIKYDDIEIIDQLLNLAKIDLNKYLSERKPYLTTQQIEELISKGFSFGAHTMTHPELRFISKEKQLTEITDSVTFVQHKFNVKYRAFAFPFTDFGLNAELFKILYNNQNPLLDISFGTAGIKNDSIPQNIQRIPMEKENLNASFILKYQYLKYFIFSFVKKNKINRT